MGCARQTVGLVTAAFVLLCHVYCACGGPHASAVATTARADATSGMPSCHAHHGGKGPSKNGKPAAPGHRSEAPCEHCKPAQTADSGDAKNPSALKPSVVPSPPFAPWAWTDGLAPATAGLPAILVGLPPPQPANTLLRLHCALNT